MQKLTCEDDLIGQTIRWAGEGDGRCSQHFVLVFESNDWALIEADDSGDGAYGRLDGFDIGWTANINNFLSPLQLFTCGLCNQAYMEHLIAQQKTEEVKQLRLQIERVQQQLAEAERAA